MRILGILSLCALGLTATAVAARLIWLWRRTRQVPELLMGLGLLSMGALGLPISAVGRLPGMVRTELGDGLFALGIAVVSVGGVLIFAFTRQVFHPAARWARMAVTHAVLVHAVVAVGLIRASSRGTTLPEILTHTRPWACALVGVLSLAFAWAAVAAFRYFAMQRRKLALGLADPVVTNRFLLWGLANGAISLLCATLILCLMAKMVILRDPLPLTIIGAVGVPASAAWYLTFFPPARYVESIRRRAAAASAATR